MHATPYSQVPYPSLATPLTPPSSITRSFTFPSDKSASSKLDTPIYSNHASLPPTPKYELSEKVEWEEGYSVPYRWDAPPPSSPGGGVGTTTGLALFNPANRANLLSDLTTLFGSSSPSSSPSKTNGKSLSFGFFPSTHRRAPSLSKHSISAPVPRSFTHTFSGSSMNVLIPSPTIPSAEPTKECELSSISTPDSPLEQSLPSPRSSYSTQSTSTKRTSESSFYSSSISPYETNFPITPPSSKTAPCRSPAGTFGVPTSVEMRRTQTSKGRVLRKRRSRGMEMEGWVRKEDLSEEEDMEEEAGSLEVAMEEGDRWAGNWV